MIEKVIVPCSVCGKDIERVAKGAGGRKYTCISCKLARHRAYSKIHRTEYVPKKKPTKYWEKPNFEVIHAYPLTTKLRGI